MRKCKYIYKNWLFKDKQCPHEALPDSDFCKWHEPKDGKDFSRQKIQETDLAEAYLVKANLKETKFKEGTDLRHVNLQRADLRYANLQKANLSNADLKEADLEGANLQGAILQGANLQEAKLIKAKLQHADLRYANLQGANLKLSRLQDADLRQTKLQGAKLQYTKLEKADLWSADLQGALFWDANLRNANLRKANLKGAILHETEIREAKEFEHAIMFDTESEEIIQVILGDLILENKQSPKEIRDAGTKDVIDIKDLTHFKSDNIFSGVELNLRKESLSLKLIHLFHLDSRERWENIDMGGIENLSKKCFDVYDSAHHIGKTMEIMDQVRQFVKNIEDPTIRISEEEIEKFVEDLTENSGPLEEKTKKIKDLIVKNYNDFLKKEIYTKNDSYLDLANRCYIDAQHTYSDLKNRFKEHGRYDDSGQYFIKEFKAKGKIYSTQSRIFFHKTCKAFSLSFRKVVFWEKKKQRKGPNNDYETFWNSLKALCKTFSTFASKCARLFLNRFLFITSQYGEDVPRLFITTILIIFFYAGIYSFSGSIIGQNMAKPIHNFWTNLYFSIVTFTTLGYGDLHPVPSMGIRLLAGSEAFLGAFVLAYFIVVVSRKIMR